ncbi:MAG: hypothetical protein WAV73_01845 [Candidatus Moraniibacteriota bacterium]
MKKNIVIVIAIAVTCMFVVTPSFIWAEDSLVDRVSTSITLKNDWHFVNGGKSFDTQEFFSYSHFHDWGGGVVVSESRTADSIQVKPYATWNDGPWYLVGGASFGDCGQFFQAGGWYINSFGKLNVIVDMRNYFGLDAKSLNYLDSFWEVSYPLGDKFFVGVDAVYDYWWSNSNQWAMIGPFVGYNINKTISVFVRWTHEWDLPSGAKTTEANVIRLGLTFNF